MDFYQLILLTPDLHFDIPHLCYDNNLWGVYDVFPDGGHCRLLNSGEMVPSDGWKKYVTEPHLLNASQLGVSRALQLGSTSTLLHAQYILCKPARIEGIWNPANPRSAITSSQWRTTNDKEITVVDNSWTHGLLSVCQGHVLLVPVWHPEASIL